VNALERGRRRVALLRHHRRHDRAGIDSSVYNARLDPFSRVTGRRTSQVVIALSLNVSFRISDDLAPPEIQGIKCL
jgi:hypothetical protein